MLPIGDLLEELQAGRFYGSVEVKFEAGRIVLIRKTETYKPTPENSNYRNNRGSENEESKR
jgi:hypothetical protein